MSSLYNLEEFRTANTFSLNDFATLVGKLPTVKCVYFEPYHDVNYGGCKKCNSNKIILSGKTTRNLICPNCNIKKLNEHIDKFLNIKNSVNQK